GRGRPRGGARTSGGAAGLAPATRLYNIEPKDGTTVGIFQDSIAFAPLLSNVKLEFDPLKFNWLGSLDKFVPIVLVWHTKPFFSFEDTKKNPMSIGASGVGSNSFINPTFLNAFVGTKFSVVNGYPGSADITLPITPDHTDA